MIKAVLVSVAVVLASVVGITYLALELGEVAIVETVKTDGTGLRQTHIWYVQDGDVLYLEAGHPDNPWVRDLDAAQTLTLKGEDIDGEYPFEQHRGQVDHERIRALMRSKYGWRDAWIGVLFDTSQSRLVEIESVE